MIARLRQAVRRLRADLDVFVVAGRDPRVPWPARAVLLATVAYALSPVDLIPDVIPVLGLLDDLLIVPAGLWLALRMIPPEVIAEARETIRAGAVDTLVLRQTGFRIVLGLWTAALVACWVLLS